MWTGCAATSRSSAATWWTSWTAGCRPSVSPTAPPPRAGGGLWYLVQPSCSVGSWQSSLGAEPARDVMLPSLVAVPMFGKRTHPKDSGSERPARERAPALARELRQRRLRSDRAVCAIYWGRLLDRPTLGHLAVGACSSARASVSPSVSTTCSPQISPAAAGEWRDRVVTSHALRYAGCAAAASTAAALAALPAARAHAADVLGWALAGWLVTTAIGVAGGAGRWRGTAVPARGSSWPSECVCWPAWARSDSEGSPPRTAAAVRSSPISADCCWAGCRRKPPK